ncbi:unnamed protein product [Blepharisma stoltei]|uniref:Malectin domain-containing protein n=1 Tax=Blepharisma stoltei TaxID=1481888 RepID=A0AAU9IFA5_9CILI|nr:unnamed protein product [Blepharisma stoltei]
MIRHLYFGLIALNFLLVYTLDGSNIALAINAGGEEYASSLGFSYIDDTNYYAGKYCDALQNLNTINNTVNGFIYQSCRLCKGTWEYNLPISSEGSYVLVLQFAEIQYEYTNQRVFNVTIGDHVVASHLDLVAAAGFLTAYDIFISFNFLDRNVSIDGRVASGAYQDGNLQVRFYAVIERPALSGLILVKGECTVADNCNMCYQERCLECNNHDLTCNKCINNASINNGVCQCNEDTFWEESLRSCVPCNLCNNCVDCMLCASSFYMYLGWCVSKCPDGFIESDSDCVENDPFIFYLSFDTLKGVVYDKQSKIPAVTGNSIDFYPDYDEFDPVAAFNRGFYFNGVSSLMHLPPYSEYSDPVLSFGYSFTFAIWINIENSFGSIISKQDLLYNPIFSLQIVAGVPLISLNLKTAGLSPFFYLQSLESYEWAHIAFAVEYANIKQANMILYLNGVINSQLAFGSDYFEDTKTDITFTIGAEKDSAGYKSYFKGFIYDIKGYNSVASISTLSSPAGQCTENCKACLTNGTCIPNCLISQYWYGPQYNKCYKCSSGCPSCRASSSNCNLCKNPKCESCYDFTSESCTKCAAGAFNTTNCQCNYGLAWNSTLGVCEPCHQWQFKANDSCYDCPPLCAECDSESKCTRCISNATLSSGSCICSPGYTGTEACIDIPFDVSLSINENNTLVLNFSEALKQDLRKDQISIKIHNDTIPSWSVSKLSSTEFLISCRFEGEISKGTNITIYFVNSASIVSVSGGLIHEKYLESALYSSSIKYHQQSAFDFNFPDSPGEIVAFLSILSGLISPNPSALLTILNNIQIFTYIPYADYPLSDKVSDFLKSLTDFKLVPNLFLLFIDQSNSAPYSRASKFGYNSYLLLVNIGDNLVLISFIYIAIFLAYLIRINSQRYILSNKFGFFLQFLIASYLDHSFSAVVGILSTTTDKVFDNALYSTNYFLCWFVVVMVI